MRLISNILVLVECVSPLIPQIFTHEYPCVLRHEGIPIKKADFCLILWGLVGRAVYSKVAGLERLQKVTFSGAV
jgi:hypothetical protein